VTPTGLPADRDFFRHTLATLAYRAAKVLRDAPEEFGRSTISGSTRTPSHILAHMCDLFDWALSNAQGAERWANTVPGPWGSDTDRFFTALGKFDAHLASNAPVACPLEQLFQGPVADALTHVGQLAMLRRLAGCPMKGENYYRADIAAGRVGMQQPSPRREF
jgi:hypothetical protein